LLSAVQLQISVFIQKCVTKKQTNSEKLCNGHILIESQVQHKMAKLFVVFAVLALAAFNEGKVSHEIHILSLGLE